MIRCLRFRHVFFFVRCSEKRPRQAHEVTKNSWKNTLKSWSPWDISVYRRITIVKTQAVSKVTFFCRYLETMHHFPEEVSNLMVFDFIWNHKPAKIKKTSVL